jgi:hypothetical protein
MHGGVAVHRDVTGDALQWWVRHARGIQLWIRSECEVDGAEVIVTFTAEPARNTWLCGEMGVEHSEMAGSNKLMQFATCGVDAGAPGGMTSIVITENEECDTDDGMRGRISTTRLSRETDFWRRANEMRSTEERNTLVG